MVCVDCILIIQFFKFWQRHSPFFTRFSLNWVRPHNVLLSRVISLFTIDVPLLIDWILQNILVKFITRCPQVFTYLSVQNTFLLLLPLQFLYTAVTRVNCCYISSSIVGWRLCVTSVIKHFRRGSYCFIKLSEINLVPCLILAALNLHQLVSFYFECCCGIDHLAVDPRKLLLELILFCTKCIFTVTQKHSNRLK